MLIGGANAEPEDIRERKAGEEKYLVVDARSRKQTRASNKTLKFDWSDIPEADLLIYGAENYCGRALDGMGRVCVDAAEAAGDTTSPSYPTTISHRIGLFANNL